MFDSAQIQDFAEDAEIAAIDVSAFEESDILNVVLQRSEVMTDVEKGGRLIRAWSDGDSAPLQDLVADRGEVLLRRGLAVLKLEYDAMRPVLDKLAPKHIADIGCGYGFFDLFAAKDYGCKLTLIDLESNENRHFGFKKSGAAYSSLKIAAKFLKDNGVPAKDITTLNPEKDDVDGVRGIDLATSFLSCGYHYPLSTYDTFWREAVAEDGAILVDLRQARLEDQLSNLVGLGQTSALWKDRSWTRVLCRKPVFGEL